MTDACPDNCLRGVRREDWVKGTRVLWVTFRPDGNPVNGWCETSINWEYDENAITELQSRRTGDSIHYRGGVVRVHRTELDRIIEDYDVSNEFKYEPSPTEGNEYHGNLLFIHGISKELKSTICGAISKAADDIIHNQSD